MRVGFRESKDEHAHAGLGLKAAWFGAEAFGKLVGGPKEGKAKSPSSPALEGKKTLCWKDTKDGIRADFDENYFVSGAAAMNVYDAQCEFADPFVSFKGVDRFKENLTNFGKLTCALKASNLMEIWHAVVRIQATHDRAQPGC
jgi:hypothetical protein